MELTAQSLCHAKLPKPLLRSTFLSQALPDCKTSVLAYTSFTFQCSRSLLIHLQGARIRGSKQKILEPICASGAESPSAANSERWLLEPIGDGDTRHIGFEVKMPGAFEIASSEVTVGRVAGKADMAIPVATVSGVHARLQNKQGSLLVTDLDSTNGTFIDDQRLRPGVAAAALPGSCITFGDTHLAIFRVSRLENVEAAKTPEEFVEAGKEPEVSKEKVADTPAGKMEVLQCSRCGILKMGTILTTTELRSTKENGTIAQYS